MPQFGSPFSELANSRKLTDAERVDAQVLRLDLHVHLLGLRHLALEDQLDRLQLLREVLGDDLFLGQLADRGAFHLLDDGLVRRCRLDGELAGQQVVAPVAVGEGTEINLGATLRTLLKIVYSRPTSKIELTFDNKVVIIFPSSLISFLKGLDQSEAENIVIKNRGSSLYWPEIDNEITVSALLEAILGISVCLE